MKDEKLTNYDRYILSKQNSVSSIDMENSDNCSYNNEYEKYLITQLRRTTPSETPILSETEFYANKNKFDNRAFFSSGSPAMSNEGTGASANAAEAQKSKNLRFKKGGKILLIVYVIFMVALASILIASNTSGMTFNEVAGAESPSAVTESTGQIRAMSIEEDEGEETSWFDRLCDSLNK